MTEAPVTHPALKFAAEPVKPVAAMTVSGVPPELQHDLAQKITKASLEWASQNSQMQRYESDFAVDLARCQHPFEAVALCSKWLAHRVDSAVSMQHRLLELWLDAVTTAAEKELVARTGDEPGGERSDAH